jgi:hypothetical protein
MGRIDGRLAGGGCQWNPILKGQSTNMQAPEKFQAPSAKKVPEEYRPFWNLKFGASLELGCWDLELFTLSCFAHPLFNG